MKCIAICAILLLLLPMTLSASGSVEIATTVPATCTIRIEADTNGTYRVGDKEYSGQNSFIVKRFESLEVKITPTLGLIAEVTVGNKALNPTTSNTWKLTDIKTDATMRIKFVPDPNYKMSLVPPESCVISVGENKTLTAQTLGNKPISYLWEVSMDGGITWITAPGTSNEESYEIVNAQMNPNDSNREYIYRLTVRDAFDKKTSCTCKILVMDEYQYRRVSYTEDVISVTTYMHDDTKLQITYLTADESDATKIMDNMEENQIPLLTCDVSLVNDDGEIIPYFGDLVLEFYVGDTFNGQTLRVFHLHGDELKTHVGYVENGYLTVVADSLSVFAVEVSKSLVYQVTVKPSEHGEITPAGTVYTGMNSDLLLEFNPHFGYHITQLLIDNVEVVAENNRYLLENVKGNSTIEVTFARYKWDHVFWLTVGSILIVGMHFTGLIIKTRKKHKHLTTS